MGNSLGLTIKSEDPHENNTKYQLFRTKKSIPIEILIAHFTPSSFPVLPVITPKFSTLCKRSWSTIIQDELNENGEVAQSGMTSFYNEFYERLNEQDKSGEFDAVLSRNITGLNKIAAKGSIIIRIIRFVLTIESDSKETRQLITRLGISHSRKKIQPWQYSIFVETLLLTISSKLKYGATNDVMEAWVNLFAYIMKYMLVHAIKDRSIKAAVALKTNVWTSQTEQEPERKKSIPLEIPTAMDNNSISERKKSPIRAGRAGSVTSMNSDNLLSEDISPSVSSKERKSRDKKEKKGHSEGAGGRNRSKSATGVCPVTENSIPISIEENKKNPDKGKKIKDGLKAFSKIKTTTATTTATAIDGTVATTTSTVPIPFSSMDTKPLEEYNNYGTTSSNFTKPKRDSTATTALSSYSHNDSKRNIGTIDVALASPESSFFSRPMSPSPSQLYHPLQLPREQLNEIGPDEIF